MIGWALASKSGPPHRPVFPPATVVTVTEVHLGGVIESTTTLRGDLWVLTCRQHCLDPWSSAVRGQLVELSDAGHPIKRFAVADPGAVAGGDGSIWVAHFTTGDVTRIDPQTGREAATIHLRLPKGFATTYVPFEPSGISFGAGRVWISSPFGYTAEINPRTDRLQRMVFTSRAVISATTAGGLTWVADELDGVGTLTADNGDIGTHHISWAGQPVDVQTVAYGAGLVWALGSETNYAESLTNPTTTSVVTTINPHAGRILHQWPVVNGTTMVIANGGAYVGDDRDGRLFHLIPPNHVQILHVPESASLTSATAHALWATTPAGPTPPLGTITPTRLLRIELPRH